MIADQDSTGAANRRKAVSRTISAARHRISAPKWREVKAVRIVARRRAARIS